MQFNFDSSLLELAKAELHAKHPDENLFSGDYDIPRFELSLPSLNYILSGKYSGPGSGFPMGKLYNFWGAESSGKSTLALMIFSDILNSGGAGVWHDAERSFDIKYASTYNIDLEGRHKGMFVLGTPDYGEQAFDTVMAMLNGAVQLQIVDSVSALGTKTTFESDAERNDIASLAKKLAEHLQKVIGPAADRLCSIIYINQERERMEQVGGRMMVIPGKKHTGGNAMKFYPHVSLKFTKKKKDEKDGDYRGENVEIEAVKNKCGRPKLKANFYLVSGEGFSREIDILNLAVEVGVVETAGSRFRYGGSEIGNGQNQARLKLKEKPELLEEIWQKTKVLLDPPEELPVSEGLEGIAMENDDTQQITKKTKKRA